MLKKLRKMLKKQEGFTLVELMIVVVILGILAGIGVQQYGNIQQRAKKAADEANRKVLTNATHMWLILGSGLDEKVVNEEDGVYEVTEEDLVSQYLDDWPVNPLNEDDPYIVIVTTKGDPTTDDLQYSIKVGTESEREELLE